MNEVKRNSLCKAISYLNSARILVETVCDKEQDAIENYPENLQGTDSFRKMEDAAEDLESAGESIELAQEQLQEVIVAICEAQTQIASAMR